MKIQEKYTLLTDTLAAMQRFINQLQAKIQTQDNLVGHLREKVREAEDLIGIQGRIAEILNSDKTPEQKISAIKTLVLPF